MDRYLNFNELKKYENDFTVVCHDRNADVTIVAPHGGKIETHTSEIAALIAADDCNLFCFNGMKEKNNQDLHITSHRFDHKLAVDLVKNSSVVITIHGCTDKHSVIYLGGLDGPLLDKIADELALENIRNLPGSQRFAGTSKNNICNRGIRKKGVQIEISRPLRDSQEANQIISAAVRRAIVLS